MLPNSNEGVLIDPLQFDILASVIEDCENNNPYRYEFCKVMTNKYNVSLGLAVKAYSIFQNEKEAIFEYINQQNTKEGDESFININTIKKLIKNKYKEIFNKINWNKIPIFNKQSNEKRMALRLTNNEFKKELNQFISSDLHNNNNDNIMPIIMFDDNHNKTYHIEYIQTVKIYNNCIGISYKYDKQRNMIKPVAIYLDKEFIQKKHELILSKHDCQCLNNFISNIDHLFIGNPNHENNELIYYKNRCEKLTKFIENSLQNIKKTNNKDLEEWIEKAIEVATNEKIVDNP